MVSITKTLFRTALIGGLAVGGLALVVGPHRMMAGVHQARHTVVGWVDDNVQNPVILRHQLQQLKEEYPARLRKITRSLAEVEGQIAQIESYRDTDARAVDIARADLDTLEQRVNTAETQLASYDSTNRGVLIQFQGNLLTVPEAYQRASRIKQSAVNNMDKVAHYDRELEILNKYRSRLVEQQSKLQKEYTAFQNQYWQIERQIEQVERNENLIELMKECQVETGDESSKFNVKNLESLSNRLAAVQAEHEAILQSLDEGISAEDYSQRAREEMQLEKLQGGNPFDWDVEDIRIEPEDFPATPLIIDDTVVEKSRKQLEGEAMASLSSEDR